MKSLKNRKIILIIIISIILVSFTSVILYNFSSKRVYKALDNMISYNSYDLKIDFHNKIDDVVTTDLEVKIDNDIEYVKNNIQEYYNHGNKLVLPFYKEEETIWYYNENTNDDFYIENYHEFYKKLFNHLKGYNYKKTLKGYSIKEDNFELLKEYMKEIYLRNGESIGISDKYGQYQIKDDIKNIELILKQKKLKKITITYTPKCVDEKGNTFDCNELNYELPSNEVIVTFDNYNNTKISIPNNILKSIEEFS